MEPFYDPVKLPSSDTYGATVSVDVEESQFNYGEPPSAGWDYAFAFCAPKSTTEHVTPKQRLVDTARIALLNDLKHASFCYSQLWVPSIGCILVRIGLPEDALMKKAESSGLALRTRPEYSGGYLAFSRSRAYIFENYNRKIRHLPYFTPAERLLLTQVTLRSREDWGADINASDMFRDQILIDAFPLHSYKELRVLIRAAVKDSWWNPFRGLPLYALYEYLGARVTLYFAWILFYTRMLSGFTVLSVLVFIVLTFVPSEHVHAWVRLAFGVAVSFWSTYWSCYWQRRNAVLNVRWGLTETSGERENSIRDDFHGVETQGFYSEGGFVHLSDLANSSYDGDDSNHSSHSNDSNHNSDANVNTQQIEQPVLQATESTTIVDRDDHFTDEIINENIENNSVVIRLQSERVTLATLLRNEVPDDHPVVVIGGGSDEDFSVEAPVTGRTFDGLPVYPYCSRKLVRRRTRVAAAITVLFAIVIGVLSFCILYYRTALNHLAGVETQSGVVSGVATAILIIVADNSWRLVSAELTRWENHHTNQRYENSLILKRFAFQFVSSKYSRFILFP